MNVFDVLNQQVANWTVLNEKLHNYHWYVKGEHFFTLHQKFEELYDEAAAHIDELAERLLSIGGKPVGTLSGCLELATIKEASGKEETAQDMVGAIAEDFGKMIEELKLGIEIAGAVNDEPTADLFISIQASLEKHVWMLRAFLGSSITV